MFRRLIILIPLIIISFQIFSQEYLSNVRHYNLELGLETRDIRHIIKDSQGFMWFTSEAGAYRFDGYEFKSYKRKVDDSEPYAFDKMGEDSEKNIWFRHSSLIGEMKVSILPFGVDSLVSFDEFFKNKKPFPNKDILKLSFKSNNLIFMVTYDGGLYEFHNNTFTKIYHFQFFYSDPGLGNRFHFDVAKISNNHYWIRHKDNLIYLSPDGVETKGKVKKEYISVDEKKRLWNYDYTSFYIKEKIDEPFKPRKLIDQAINNSIYPSNSNSSFQTGYILTSKSRLIYDLSLIDIESSDIINIEPFGKEGTNISPYSYFIENKNSIWLTTHDGIYHIQLKKKIFTNYLQGENLREMIRSENNHLWVTSHSGLHKLNLKTQRSETKSDTVFRVGRSFLLDSSNGLWMGKLNGTVPKINASTFQVEKEYFLKNKTYSFTTVNTLFREKGINQIWLGTSNGMYYFDKEKDDFFHFKESDKFESFNQATIHHVYGSNELILAATAKGIFQLDAEKKVVQHFSTHNNTLPYNNILHIHHDKTDNTFWLATKLGGLIHWDKKNNTSKIFTRDDGLADNLIYAVYEDDNEYLWMPTNLGLMRFNKKTYEVKTFTTYDGLPYDEFNYYSHYKDNEGNLYFGGLNGLTTFHPDDFSIDKKNMPLVITDFKVLNPGTGEMKSRLNDFPSDENHKNWNEISLKSTENSFVFNFALLDFQQPDINSFEYKIEGLNDKWSRVEGNELRINSLPYGSYNFFIRGKNSEGLWSDDVLNIPVFVKKPFYLNGWFFLFCILALAFLVYYFIKRRTAKLSKEKAKLELEVANRTKEINKQAEELKKLVEVKTRFFANVTHELRTPLALIISPLKQLMNTQTLDDESLRILTSISKNGEKLKELVEELLDLSRYDTNKLKLNKKPFHFLNAIRNWVTGFDMEAQNRGIDFQLYFQLPIDLHVVADDSKLKKVVLNLLSNAFKFSRSGDSIELVVLEENEKIIIKVIDTGDGIHEDDLPHIFERFFQSKQTDTQLHGGLGIGLALSKELSNLMDGKLSATSTLGKGSTFIFEFPKEIAEEKIVLGKEMLEKNPKQSSPLSPTFSKSKNNILIVEDNSDMRLFIQDLLSPYANIFLANNGVDALQILKKQSDNIHLIISDLMMPEMDGFTLLEKLKAKKSWQLIPVIMLTARTDISDKLKAITIGVDDYLIKPFEPEELIARMKNLMKNTKLREVNVPEHVGVTVTMDSEELESADIKWLKNVEEIAIKNITRTDYNVTQLAFDIALGDRQLNRKLKKLTGLTPGNYLKEIRLQKARHYLENRTYLTVSEVAYAVGFSSPVYFSTVYKKRYGKVPSAYLKEN